MTAFTTLTFGFAIIFTIIAPVKSQATDLFITVNPDTNMLLDSQGRERFFHGTNVVVKHKPFHPELNGYSKDSFSEIDMKILQSLGLNTIRLGMLLYYLYSYYTVLSSLSLSCLLYTSPSPRDGLLSRMPSSA